MESTEKISTAAAATSHSSRATAAQAALRPRHWHCLLPHRAGPVSDCRANLEGLIRYDPDQYGADNELAGLQKRLGRNDDARKTLANAYARGGDKDTSTVVSYAGILRLFGETNEALAVLQKHEASGPARKGYLFNLGDILTELNRYEDAKDAFTELVELHPGVVDFTVVLAKTHMKLAEDKLAISLLEDAIAAYPDQFSADIALSDIYLEQQQTAAAKDVMAKAYSRGGDQLPVLKQYTKVLALPWRRRDLGRRARLLPRGLGRGKILRSRHHHGAVWRNGWAQ